MWGNKNEAAQAAADRIKAALSAANGLIRTAPAAAAARNVNAYGQKEEGPSRWQERREAKRQMYLMSTEKAVNLGVRKDSKPRPSSRCATQHCQKCFQSGHWTYQCSNERVYVSRPSQTQQLNNPKLNMRINSVPYELDNPDNPQNALGLQPVLSAGPLACLDLDKQRKRKRTSRHKTQRKKTKRKFDDSSDSDVSETDSEESGSQTETSDSGSTSSGTSSESDSEEERRKRKKHTKRRHLRPRKSLSDSEYNRKRKRNRATGLHHSKKYL